MWASDLERLHGALKARVQVLEAAQLPPEPTFEERIRRLAREDPTMRLEWAVWFLDHESDDVPAVPPANAPVEVMAEFVFGRNDIMQLCREGKKINAIKDLRTIAGIGLREAKDAVELAAEWERAGRTPRIEREKIERETQEAIASIQRLMRGE